jgi:hypothetical protein
MEDGPSLIIDQRIDFIRWLFLVIVIENFPSNQIMVSQQKLLLIVVFSRRETLAIACEHEFASEIGPLSPIAFNQMHAYRLKIIGGQSGLSDDPIT